MSSAYVSIPFFIVCIMKFRAIHCAAEYKHKLMSVEKQKVTKIKRSKLYVKMHVGENWVKMIWSNCSNVIMGLKNCVHSCIKFVSWEYTEQYVVIQSTAFSFLPEHVFFCTSFHLKDWCVKSEEKEAVYFLPCMCVRSYMFYMIWG